MKKRMSDWWVDPEVQVAKFICKYWLYCKAEIGTAHFAPQASHWTPYTNEEAQNVEGWGPRQFFQ